MAPPETSADRLTSLKRSRAPRRRYLDKLLSKLGTEVAEDQVLNIEETLAQIGVKEAELIMIDRELEELFSDTALEEEMEETALFSDKIIAAKVKANRVLSAHKVQVNPSSAGVTTSTKTKIAAQLPKLQIARFEGKLTDWSRFSEQFKASIDGNTGLSAIDKFSYLKSLLAPHVSTTIQGLQLSGANYLVAQQLLEEKYGKPSVLKNEHIQAILKIRPVENQEDGSDLRRFYEECQVNLRSLETLGVNLDSLGVLICPIIFQSMSSGLLREWHRRYQSTKDEDLMHLLKFIHQELEGMEKAWRTSGKVSQKKLSSQGKQESRKMANQKKEPQQATASSLVASTGWGGSRKRSCLFCDSQDHWTSGCTAVPSYKGRIEALQAAKRCFRCFSDAHFSRSCDQKVVCRGCQGKHHTLLCKKILSEQDTSAQGRQEQAGAQRKGAKMKQDRTGQESEVVSATANVLGRGQGATVALQTIQLWIQHNGKRKKIVALLDGGSERSFICKHLVDELRLDVSEEGEINIRSFGGNKLKQSCRVVQVPIESGSRLFSIHALEVQEICHGVKVWETEQINELLANPKEIQWKQFITSGKPEKVDLLIGSDLYWRIATGHMKRIGSSVMAIETIFGWTIQGRIEATGRSEAAIHTLHAATEEVKAEEATADQLMKKLWELDQMGNNSHNEERTLGELEALEDFERKISFQDGRYSVGIPWNHSKDKLCGNYGMAMNRLKRLLLRLKKDPELFQRYAQGMRDYLEAGHIEPVPEPQKVSGPLYYMPHQPVIKEDRTTMKLRIVFDASAKAPGLWSLNDCQDVGPNLNPNIFDVLLRFRQHRIGIVSDVEKAFLQVKLNKEERNATRFFWIKEEELGKEAPTIQVFRMKRVLFGMKASPFLLAATIRHHVKKYQDSHPEISKSIDINTYVDDHVTGADSVEKGYQLYKETQDILQQGGMSLKKWTSNDLELTQKWIQEKVIDKDARQIMPKVLGMHWNTQTDELQFKISWKQEELQKSTTTKREALKIAASLFDPLGILGPVLLQAKWLLQEAWRKKVGWDEELPQEIGLQWKKWKTDLTQLEEVTVPRWTKASDHAKMKLHIFCDASQKGYGAVAYLRCQEEGDLHWTQQLVAAKSRVAPLQLVSLPRLELMGCLLGAALGNSLLEAWGWKSAKVTYWSDSKVALQWLSDNPSKWKLFVARRVQQIQEITQPEQWRHCKGKDNPADIQSRGCCLAELRKNVLWWEGPRWLGNPEVEEAGKDKEEPNEEQEVDAEKQGIKEISVLCTTNKEKYLLDLGKFSSWKRLIRVTAWVLRFGKNCRKKSEEQATGTSLKAIELKEAEEYWMKINQQENFTEEKNDLEKEKEVSHSSRIKQLAPFIDKKGLIRLGGRLKWAHLTFNQKHPVILGPGRGTDLMIMDKHEERMHGGVSEVMTKLREQVWIIRGRQEVRRALKRCLKCRRWQAKPGQEEQAPLPEERVSRSKAFAVTGLDYFGPLWVKVAGAQEEKNYVCLFTCGVTRAVHLELVSSQSSEDFMLAFRRFLARRGECKIIWSDNAQSFRQADRLVAGLIKAVTEEKVQDFAAKKGITWKFIAPRASWWGGFYERIVGLVKQHLKKSLGQAKLNQEELRTVLTEVEAVVNERPLTYVSEDPANLDYLTPGQFLLQQKSVGLPEFKKEIPEFPRQAFIRRWRYQCQIVERFWRRWTKEYLLMLRAAVHKEDKKKPRIIMENDVVIVMQERMPRGTWKLARVLELIKGRDGKVRSVVLKTAAGEKMRRAVQQVCPLEVAGH